MRKLKATVLHRERLIEELRDPRLARAYLAAAIEDADPRVLLAALRTVVEARGMARVVEKTGIPRESLYRTLSSKGNPRLTTLLAVVKAAGFRFSLEGRKDRTAGLPGRYKGKGLLKALAAEKDTNGRRI
jgi:probable addiction module antidote protein